MAFKLTAINVLDHSNACRKCSYYNGLLCSYDIASGVQKLRHYISFGKYHYLLDYTGIQSDIWYYQKERRPAEWKLLQTLRTGKN